MKQRFFALSAYLFISLSVFAQATHVVIDPEKKFNHAKDLFMHQQYALAYPLLKETVQEYPDNKKSGNYYLNEDARYYYIVCELKMQLSIAEDDAKDYIVNTANEPRDELISYHLANYYFTKEAFTDAIKYYERAGLDNLDNNEIADAKFRKAYCYFNLKRFSEAKPLFNEIHQLAGTKYYIQANYYYGFICFYDHQYDEALNAFKVVETRDEYKTLVPYYIAEIYYFQGKKDEALKHAKLILDQGGSYYQKEMEQLVGQIYFEKSEFKMALPYLEYYVNNSDKVSKEDLYELSYCYYANDELDKASAGFKQLSSDKDSLGQNSMYLLGDCYLRSNQKENARTAFQYCADNSSNTKQQEISRFNYAKLSYELGYQDIALNATKKFLNDYPGSEYAMEAKEILVALLANTNSYSDALALYNSLDKPTLAMQRIYPRILYGRAVQYMNDQEIGNADSLFRQILLLPPSNVDAYTNFWKGEIAYRETKYDDAIRYLSIYLQSNTPAQGEANPTAAKYDLGYSWLMKENYNEALNYFNAIAKPGTASTPLQQDAYVRSADCYYMNKDFTKANNAYDNIINNALLQSDYALFQKAMIAGIKNPAEKIKLLNSLCRQYPQSSFAPDANIEIANTYMANEQFKEAIPYLNNILTATDTRGLQPKAYLKLGLSYYNLNDNSNALNNYQSLLQKYPESPEADEALDNIKSIYVEEGKPNDYIALMRKSGKNISASEADSITYQAALLKYNNNDCNSAIDGFNNYLTQYPTGAFLLNANFFRSECYSKNNDWKNALPGYDFVNSKGINNYFEKATLAAAQINYFQLKDYAAAEKYFQSLRTNAVNQDNQLEALRGLVRCFYQLKDYAQANDIAKELLTKKGISTDDKSISFLVLGKSQQANNDCTGAIASFKSCATINKSAWGAEARYALASCEFALNNFAAAEKAAMATIKETGSYDEWVTRSYILLGDIFMQQKDYFNAKATYQSVAQNSVIPELKTEAQQKLDKATEEEKKNSKITN